MNIYNDITTGSKKKICVQIDPDRHTEQSVKQLVIKSENANIDYFLLGSSLLQRGIDDSIELIKKYSKIPIILFPGSLLQLSLKADALLFLSLISGRNPELLIGKHVEAAPLIKRFGMETISTGYILAASGTNTSVEYISNTKPVPYNKPDIAVATAVAGELLGMKLIYIDAGSGAKKPVSADMIKAVKLNISIPLIIGGGIKTKEQIIDACKAGADMIVVGNVVENDDSKITELASVVHQF